MRLASFVSLKIEEIFGMCIWVFDIKKKKKDKLT